MMHPALRRTDHRPWAQPSGRWTWRQKWHDLLFAHWPVATSLLRPLVPPELDIEEFDGTSWIGVVPFHMSGVARRPLPDVPFLSAFPELNLRVYVSCAGKPGVWFLSRARFAPEAAPFRALPGTIEHFLMERYCLYSRSPTGRILRTNVHHAPWSLCAASAEIEENALFAAQGLAITGPPRLTHFAELADVVIWPPERVEISSQ
jgi:uncharacterized protein YqjF (DUF2071 family)